MGRTTALLLCTLLGAACSSPSQQCLESCAGCCSADGTCRGGGELTACGAEGTRCAACGAGQACVFGACVTDATGGGSGGGAGGGGGGTGVAMVGPDGCLPGLSRCAGVCVQLASDNANCGVCGRACGSGQLCNAGSCTSATCQGGVCPPGSYCKSDAQVCVLGCVFDGNCALPNTRCDTATRTCVCRTATHACGGQCVSNDAVTSCGSRCDACPAVTSGTPACLAQTCGATCIDGFNFCGGQCRANAPSACGASCAVCPSAPNASPTCTQGVCGADCNNGFHRCQGQCLSSSSPASCGDRCTPCPVPMFTTAATCEAEACGVACVTDATACGNACCPQRKRLDLDPTSSCAIRANGALVCWGDGPRTMLDFGGSLAAVSRTYALTTTGEVRAAQQNGAPTTVPLPAAAVSLSSSTGHTCAALETGTVYCWGSNAQGALGDGTTTDSPTPVQVSSLTDAVAVTTGGSYSCAVTRAGALRCWGYNGYGQLGDGTTIDRHTPTAVSGLSSGVVRAAAGLTSTCAVLDSGALRCWGLNADGQLGDGTTTSRTTPTPVSGLSSGVTDVAVGYFTACAIVSGAVRCWGGNPHGVLGDGTTNDRTTPAQVSGLTAGIVELALDASHACARTNANTMYCWGNNGSSQLGIGSGASSSTPVEVSTSYWP